jgi:hypothetical protein
LDIHLLSYLCCADVKSSRNFILYANVWIFNFPQHWKYEINGVLLNSLQENKFLKIHGLPARVMNKSGLRCFVTVSDKGTVREYHVWKFEGEAVGDGGKFVEKTPKNTSKRMYI